jgi:ribosome-associated heat shock protein Hsp15
VQSQRVALLDRQRIDKWLWHARVVRTRTDAAKLVSSGLVRLNSARIDAASQPVRPGDVITVALDRRVRLLKVRSFADRRGASVAARSLYDDLSPPPTPAPPPAGVREAGAGRPTKRERRAIDRLQSPDLGRDDDA